MLVLRAYWGIFTYISIMAHKALFLKTRAFIDNPAHHALHEFDGTIRELYVPKPNGWRGMTGPPAYPIGLKLEAVMASVEITVESVYPQINTQLSTGNALSWSQETQPHWISEQMYHHQTGSPG